MPAYSGKNCVEHDGKAEWEGITIVWIDGDSLGRDDTKFRVVHPKINDEQIEYVIEWSRGNDWQPMRSVSIDRITGTAVSYFMTMHGGESYQCRSGRKAF